MRGDDLHRRLHEALTGGVEEIAALLSDRSPEVLQALLKNPALEESHLFRLLRRRDLTEDVLQRAATLQGVQRSSALRKLLAAHPRTPARVLTPLLADLGLFEVADVCAAPGISPDQKAAAERALVQRLPGTPLGSRLALARRGTEGVLDALLAEGDPQVVAVCLDNPRLRESALLRFLAGPSSTPETISAAARHPRWKNRPPVLLGVLGNSRTPLVWFHLHLPRVPGPNLRELLARRLSPQQRELVREELQRRSG
ncbi:MAG TPA: hypothetical protein VNX25_07965 [Verrucomicrobiae bacterium]|nr:hypothetical protein [Verrucomicrobiae bacterium]